MKMIKLICLALTMLIILVGCLMAESVSGAASLQARIKIDIERTIGEVNKHIYGNFVEHLGRCVYGGIYDPDSQQADEKGFRKDVMEAIKGLNVSITRYPGGNFVSNYHWLDGVGPERTPRMELAWARLETNKFGTNEFVAAGSSNYRAGADPDYWNGTILHELRDVVDYIALHIYVGNPENNYYNFLATPLVLEQRTKVVKGMIDREMVHANRGERDPVYIAWDEYNVWYRARTGKAKRGQRALEEHYNLEDALVISGFLNAFVRNADIVKMANMAQLVNVIAPIFTNEETLFKQTIYYPLQLFSQNVQGTSLDVFVDCETYDTDRFFLGLGETTTVQKDVPYLDVSAVDNNGEMVICVLNRHKDEAIRTQIISQQGRFTGKFKVFEVNGPDIKAVNDFGKETVKTIQKADIDVSGDSFYYSFPPHSFTLMKGAIQR